MSQAGRREPPELRATRGVWPGWGGAKSDRGGETPRAGWEKLWRICRPSFIFAVGDAVFDRTIVQESV
jgi:hypothetical protein